MFSKCTYNKRYFLEVLLNLILFKYFFLILPKKNLNVLNYVPIVSSCPTWLRALRAYVPYEPLYLCAFDSYVVFIFFTCLTCPHLFTYLTYCLHLFTCHHFSKCFQFSTCLMCFHFFIKCRATHNQPQQAGISRNEVEKTKDSLNEPKQLRAILENYF